MRIRTRGAGIVGLLLVTMAWSSCSGDESSSNPTPANAGEPGTGGVGGEDCAPRCGDGGNGADAGEDTGTGGGAGDGSATGGTGGNAGNAGEGGEGAQGAQGASAGETGQGGTSVGGQGNGGEGGSDTPPICEGAADGTPCGGRIQICLDEMCVDSTCGDGFVDTVLGEMCDDANDVAGDGCETTCERSCTPQADTCNDGNPCNGVESCGSAFFCVAGTPPNCNDNNACTTDTCDPVLVCQHEIIDADGDGQSPSALGACGTDCNDQNPAVRAGAPDACDGIDNDCDNLIDEGGVVTWYADCDNDFYAPIGAVTVQSCARPTASPGCANGGWVTLAPASSADCNDSSATVRPGATEVVGNNVDENCDGREMCYYDGDNDGYRLATNFFSTDADCNDTTEAPASDPTGDCNDTNAAIRPNAAEVTGDQVDQNCDGRETCYRDGDNDGYRTTSTVSSTDVDCSDSGEARSTEPSGDCCDTDADARPDQTAWFDQLDGPTLCGDWDYNCRDGDEERWTGQENVCGYNVASGCGTPASDEGWVTLPGVCPLPMAPMPYPACGTPPYCFADNCHQTGPTSCSFDFLFRMQECH